MTIVSNGEISIEDIALEFGGDTPDGLFEYYRIPEGPYVTENNTNVPLSGEITLEDFYSAESIYTAVVSSNTTNLVLDSLFTTQQLSSGAKLQVTINSGVIVGSNDPTIPACRTGTGGGTTFTLINNGNIYAAGGAIGQNGGTAFKAERSINVDNTNGRLRGGGGGGANGGRAGDRFTKNYFEGTGWAPYDSYYYYNFIIESFYHSNQIVLQWGYVWQMMSSGGCSLGVISRYCNLTSGGGQVPFQMVRDETGGVGSSTDYWYEVGPLITSTPAPIYKARRFQHVVQTASVTPGGLGQGFNHNWSSGTTGTSAYNWTNAIATWSICTDSTAPYTTRAGQLAYTTDGNGGRGGDWGQAGTAGTSGTNGIITNGQSAGSAGAAGKYAEGNSNITWIGNGERIGDFS